MTLSFYAHQMPWNCRFLGEGYLRPENSFLHILSGLYNYRWSRLRIQCLRFMWVLQTVTAREWFSQSWNFLMIVNNLCINAPNIGYNYSLPWQVTAWCFHQELIGMFLLHVIWGSRTQQSDLFSLWGCMFHCRNQLDFMEILTVFVWGLLL